MNKRTDLGDTYPAGHPSGRIWQPPVSVQQARARVAYQMDSFEASVRDGVDVGYARQCLDEAVDDYIEFTITGSVDIERNAAEVARIKAQTELLAGQIAAAEAARHERQPEVLHGRVLRGSASGAAGAVPCTESGVTATFSN